MTKLELEAYEANKKWEETGDITWKAISETIYYVLREVNKK